MKYLFTILLALSLFSVNSIAQTSGKVRGATTGVGQKSLEAATITLLRATDSSAVKFAISAADGRFSFEGISLGTYLVSVSAVGHQKSFSPLFELTPDRLLIELNAIPLAAVSSNLKGVTVTARKPFIEQKMDRMIVNVDASVTNAGSTALEVLEKSPGVTVDKDGNISLKGKTGVMVMMDGRPAYLSGTELTNYLKNLPSSSLDQIEIMTNPPAKYDAAGNAGIIKINTKKGKAAGLNGSVSLNYGQGVYWRANNSVNLNYRTKNFNLFANAGESQYNDFNHLDIKRTYRNAASKNVTAIFEQETQFHNNRGSYNLKLGADYYPSKATTLGVVSSGFINPEKFNSTNTSYLMDPNRRVDSIVYATSNNNNHWKNGSLNLNLRHQFDTTGTELTTDLDYVAYGSDGSQLFKNTTFTPTWAKLRDQQIKSTLPINIKIYSAKADYTHTYTGGYKVEAGAKSSFVKTTNSAFYYNVTGTDEVTDYGKTNQFLYNENINAAYLNLNKEFGKWGVQSGLRFEHTSYKGKQFGNPTRNDSSFNKSYGSLFPTVYISYNANAKNTFGLSAGRRIERPAYQDLNPFVFFLDQYTYEAGNPFIRPQFANNIEATHTYNSFLTTTLNYSRTTDFISQVFSQEKVSATSNGYATILRRSNIGRVNSAGLSVNAQLTVAKWWSANLYTNLNYNRYQGIAEGEAIDVAATNLMANVSNQFKFGKTWSAELSGFYRTKGVDGQVLIHSMGQASVGVGKQIMGGKGALKLAVRDVLLTNTATGNISFSTTEAYFKQTRDSRVANLTFTYRFGKPAKGAQPRHKTGADDEQGRVKAGGN